MVPSVIPVLLAAIVWSLGHQPSTARHVGRYYGYREDTTGLCQIYNIQCPVTKVCMVQRLSHGPRPLDVPVCVRNKFLPAYNRTCKLPPSRGKCRATLIRWYYDSNDGQCASFRYSGCQHNGNNFFTKSICERTCIHHAYNSKSVGAAAEAKLMKRKRKRDRKRKRRGRGKKRRKIANKHKFAEFSESMRAIPMKPSAILKTRIVQNSTTSTKSKNAKKPSARPKNRKSNNATIIWNSTIVDEPGAISRTAITNKPITTTRFRIAQNPTSRELHNDRKNTNVILQRDKSQVTSNSLIGYLRQRQLRHPSSMSVRREVASGRYFRVYSLLLDKLGQRRVNRQRHRDKAHG